MMRQIFKTFHSQIDNITRYTPPLSSFQHHQRYLTSSGILHEHNRQYSLNLPANALFSRLREDASKSHLVELKFKDMVQYSSELFASSQSGHKMDESHLIESAEYVRKQLSIIIAQIIIDFQNLPYGVAHNPRIEQCMQTYIDSYTAIKQVPNIKSIQEKQQFHETLEKYLASWTQVTVVPNLCLGLLEMAQERSLQKIEACPYLSYFIDRIITRRFAARVILGHYIALHDNKWGIFEENCDVIKYIENAKNDAIEVANGVYTDDKMLLPKIIISDKRKSENEIKEDFIFSGKMIHQFTFELLKNCIRATMEFHGEDSGNNNNINIIVVNSNNGDVTIKIGDTGGGISRREIQSIWLYSYTVGRRNKKYRNNEYDIDIEERVELLKKTIGIDKYSVTHNPYYIGAILHKNVPMFGLGYGLPLVKAYSEYFGGSCNIHSIHGHGTDTYLYLPTLIRSKSNVLSLH